jgi:hypothetical protein
VAGLSGSRVRDARLATVVEIVADRVLSGKTDASMAHKTESDVTSKVVQSLPKHQLKIDSGKWRRGDSNPRPEMLQDKLLHA